MKNYLKQNWFKVLAILFSFGALGDWSYGYYQLLRWVILAVGGYSAYIAYKSENKTWAWIFGVIAVLFNPIIPFYFSRETWQPINIAVGIIFFISLFSKYKK